MKDFGRDNLWIQLRDEPINTSLEWTQLFLEKIQTQFRDIGKTDRYVYKLLKYRGLDWIAIMKYLQQVYKKDSRRLANTIEPPMSHLVLFNPKNQSFLVYFRMTFSKDGNQFEGMDLFSASREGVRDPTVEHAHLNDIVNTIIHFFWRNALEPMPE